MDRLPRPLTYGLLFLLLAGLGACGSPNPANTSPNLSAFTISPGSVNGGQNATGTVTLTTVAPAGGVMLSLITSNGGITIPPTLTISAGANTGTFKIQTVPVGSTQLVAISVLFGTVETMQAGLTIVSTNPLSLTGFTLEFPSITSGGSLNGTVTINAPAFSPGQPVTLVSSDTAVVPVSPVTVITGATKATFSIFTSAVTTPRNVVLTANLNSTSLQGQLLLLPAGTAVTGLNFIPSTVAGGSNTTGTVSISPPAPAGGAVVCLTAGFTNTATPAGTVLPIMVPGMVTVPQGAVQMQFTAQTTAVTATTGVTVTASVPTSTGCPATVTAPVGTSAFSLALTIVPSLTLSNVAVSPSTLTSGNAATGSVALSIPAPAGTGCTPSSVGVCVTLSSSSPALTVPPSVTIPAGATSAPFSVTAPIGASTTQVMATVTASLQGSSAASVTTMVTVTPGTALTVSSLTFSVTPVVGGQPVTGTVTISGAAPGGGAVVMLSSSMTSAAQVPASVTVQQNATTMTFPITTFGVPMPVNAMIMATLNNSTQTATLAVVPSPMVASVALNPATVGGGGTSICTVTLTAAAPGGGALVTLTSSSNAAQFVPSVTVPAGSASVTFLVTTLPVTTQQMVTITAAIGASSQSAILTITTPMLTLSSVTVTPNTLTVGNSGTGSITVNIPAPAGGSTIQLMSSNTTALPVPASATIPAGATSVTFPVTAGSATALTQVTITASLQGSSTASVTTMATVTPATLISFSSITFSVAPVVGGQMVTGTVTLTGAAPPAGLTVTLTSSVSNAQVPASVTVPQNATTANFSITTTVVTSQTSATITAMVNGFSGTTTLVIVPTPAVMSVTLNPTSVAGGNSSVGTVTLTAAAPGGGAVVMLSSSMTSVAQVAPSVTVPAGSASVNFTVTAVQVTTQQSAIITAMVNSTSQMATLVVVPTPTVASLALNPTSVVGGNSSVGTVTLTAAAPGSGTVVTLTSTSNVAQFAPSVTVPAGGMTVNFPVTTLPVATQQMATITAAVGASTMQAILTITPLPPDVRLVFFNPPTVTAGQPATGTVVVTTPAPAGGVSVALTSANLAAVTVPANVTVLTGSTSVTFTATTSAGVLSTTSVQVTAMITSSVTNTVTVVPAQTVALSEQILTGGETNSSDFPVHPNPGAFQTTIGGTDTGFLTSINLTTPTGGPTTSALTFSTFLGKSSFGQVRDIFVDSSGNVFTCGVTNDSGLPVTANAAQSLYGGGQDAFVAEFNSSGTLQYLSYLGGSGDETCYNLTVDSSGNIIVSGSSSSANLMGTAGVFQATNKGGNDFFVAKINPTATTPTMRLVWFTYVGGLGDDFADGRLAVDNSGHVFVSGTSQSLSDFPIPAIQGRPNLMTGVAKFGAVIQLSSDGAMLRSTSIFFGKTNAASPGTKTTTTASGGLALDASGNVYVCGLTNASDLPSTIGAFQPAIKGQQDAYIARINASNVVTALTYLGGTGTVQACKALAFDSEGNVIVVTPTDAANYPVTTAATLNGPSDIAITKLTPDLTTVVFSTLVGGSGSESTNATRIELDAAENLYFSLATNSSDFPVTSNAVQGTFAGVPGGSDTNVAVVKLSADGSTILYGTYLGGTSNNSTTTLRYHKN